MLSPLDDLPIDQVAQPVRQPGTSDRNFYDRYYFNCHPCSDELFLIIGQGQYPNLGVQDAFALVRRGDEHRVVRASRELGLDRLDTSVGPFAVEVIEPVIVEAEVVSSSAVRIAVGEGRVARAERLLGRPFALTGYVRRPVVDRTGLAGPFDFNLTYAPAARGGGPAPSDDQPSIFTAVQEQLGLKLEPATAPVEVLVVDSVSMPGEN